jgi:hypothetical protein
MNIERLMRFVALVPYYLLLCSAQPAVSQESTPTNARVSLVYFQDEPDSKPGTYQVIRDRDRLPAQKITDVDDGCGGSQKAQWEDCKPQWPDGSPEKVWPTAYVRGSKIIIQEARFKVRNVNLDDSTIIGKADLGKGLQLQFTKQRVRQAGNELIALDMTADKPLPNEVAQYDNLAISWTIEHNDQTFVAGSSKHPVYVLYGAPTVPVFFTELDFTTLAARGESTESDVVNAIWSAFTPRKLARREFDPKTGTIKHFGVALKYWTTWTVLSQEAFAYTCPTVFGVEELLRETVGRCGAWGRFMAASLNIHGINAQAKGVDQLPGFPTGPAGADLMLIKNWTFKDPAHGAGDFPYVREVSYRELADRKTVIVAALPTGADFDKAQGVPGQANPNPPGWFRVGDHLIVVYNSKIYDPSYGTGPFADIMAWATASLDGYAEVTKGPGVVKSDGTVEYDIRLEAHKGVP